MDLLPLGSSTYPVCPAIDVEHLAGPVGLRQYSTAQRISFRSKRGHWRLLFQDLPPVCFWGEDSAQLRVDIIHPNSLQSAYSMAKW